MPKDDLFPRPLRGLSWSALKGDNVGEDVNIKWSLNSRLETDYLNKFPSPISQPSQIELHQMECYGRNWKALENLDLPIRDKDAKELFVSKWFNFLGSMVWPIRCLNYPPNMGTFFMSKLLGIFMELSNNLRIEARYKIFNFSYSTGPPGSLGRP